jgi:hypothetical protein
MTCEEASAQLVFYMLLTLCTHSLGLIKRRVCMRGARAGPKNRDCWLFEVFGAQTHTDIRGRDAFCGQSLGRLRGAAAAACVCSRSDASHFSREMVHLRVYHSWQQHPPPSELMWLLALFQKDKQHATAGQKWNWDRKIALAHPVANLPMTCAPYRPLTAN